MDIPRTLRHARLNAGFTQAELAQLSGTSQATLSAYETGRKAPSMPTLQRLLLACGERLATIPATRPVRMPSRQELERRGDILAQVIDLAGHLPTRHENALRYPPPPTWQAHGT